MSIQNQVNLKWMYTKIQAKEGQTLVKKFQMQSVWKLYNIHFLAALAALCPPWLLTDGCGFRAFQTKPDQTYLTYLPDLLSWPTWATSQPDIPTHLTYPPICLAHLLDLPTHPDNLPEPTDNLQITKRCNGKAIHYAISVTQSEKTRNFS